MVMKMVNCRSRFIFLSCHGDFVYGTISVHSIHPWNYKNGISGEGLKHSGNLNLWRLNVTTKNYRTKKPRIHCKAEGNWYNRHMPPLTLTFRP